jgi:Phosphotransferase enzyme family
VSLHLASQLPDTEQLEDVLRHLLRARVTVAQRTANVYASSHASEIVAYRCGDSHARLFCKYGPALATNGHGHRRGIDYEGAVYHHVLGPAAVDTPRLWGVHHDRARNRSWLFIEYLERAQHLRKQPALMAPAAAWIGRFHACMEERVRAPDLAFLTRYDRLYFSGWPTRADQLVSRDSKRRMPWWRAVCERFAECAHILLAAPQTVIHGECYVNNIICAGERIQTIDWESAAVGAGEIDLAGLLEGWPDELAHQYVEHYTQARWPQGAPHDVARTLDAARVYLALRWLGDEPALTASESTPERFGGLERAARRLGLVA